MRTPSRTSLLALMLWANGALATSPVVAEPIFSRNLEIRQSSQSTKCPASYTTSNGLNFTTYCEQDNPFNDAQPPFQSSSMQDCMEHCSRYWGKSEGCFGIVWVESNNDCWIRNSTTSTKNLHSDPGYYAALLTTGEMQPYDTDCPNTDLSVNSLSGVSGMQYTTHCGKVINGYDACFSEDPSCFSAPYQGYFHATSLEECLQECVNAHPFCQAVSYNPGLQIGFANCWLKTGYPATLSSPDSTMGTIHSATITQIDTVDKTCPSSKTYKAQSGSTYDIHCGQLNTGSNITSIHTQNITSCMDACSTSKDKCTGILFDPTLAGGFNNCYLQNSTATTANSASATYAALSGASSTSGGSGGSSSGSSSTSKSSSKGWIAGAVLGPLIALALIAIAILLWRKRKHNRENTAKYANEASQYPYQQPGAAGAAPPYEQARYAAPATEMDGHRAEELPGPKYAQFDKAHPPVRLPTELPS